MSKRTMLMHSAHQHEFDVPDRDLAFYDRPFDTEQLSRVTDVHLWAPLDSPIDRLPEIISAMTGLKKLSIGPGRVSPLDRHPAATGRSARESGGTVRPHGRTSSHLA